eukprot:CAMPEP_0118928130 /NCGR_PEP_ID=MMETSP1169-20130426/5457_1 /TAXON_ID=36882 /ORGANISM="Pyramimonas obovata, Strain CCMP722" /LENGTH=256 /DNA_ID=CAMNT_0006870039 /DNA_START=313 /DNA_END=1083 /DNA_ORIENTATION=-
MYTIDVVQTSLLNKLDYCSRHNDTTCRLSTESSERCNSFVWEKEFSLLRHMRLHDWLLWVDCDALMANLTQSLETIAQHAQPTDDLIVIRDHNFYNLGVLMIRSSKWSEWLLKELLDMRDWMEHMRGNWRDQKALTILLKNNPDIHSHIRVVEASVLNSYAASFTPGDFIYHQVNCKQDPGGLESLVRCREEFLEKAQRIREATREGNNLLELPSNRELHLTPSAVWPSFSEAFGCVVRKLAVLHKDRTKPYRRKK